MKIGFGWINIPCGFCRGKGYIVFKIPKLRGKSRKTKLNDYYEVCRRCGGDGTIPMRVPVIKL